MKKFLKVITAVTVMAALMSGCSSTKQEETAAEPTAALAITVEPLTEDEFADVQDEGAVDAVIDDFSKITIELDMENMVPGTERTVKMTALKNIMAETGVGIHWSATGSSQNDPEETFSTFKSENIICRNGATDDEIKAMFEGYSADVTYTGADGNVVEESLPFDTAVIFK
ncbi:MAG: hypothetical protein PUD43_08215 [Clostridia bacterium]|nr:hypothetical protein [Clostridia bacterium]